MDFKSIPCSNSCRLTQPQQAFNSRNAFVLFLSNWLRKTAVVYFSSQLISTANCHAKRVSVCMCVCVQRVLQVCTPLLVFQRCVCMNEQKDSRNAVCECVPCGEQRVGVCRAEPVFSHAWHTVKQQQVFLRQHHEHRLPALSFTFRLKHTHTLSKVNINSKETPFIFLLCIKLCLKVCTHKSFQIYKTYT